MRSNTINSPDTSVAIIGAGPYGLALSSHLSTAGVPFQIFGQPMSYWQSRMPEGMLLRSSWNASHISSPVRGLSLDAYQAEIGTAVPRPIPLETFVEYGKWFQRNAAPDLREQMVECVEQDGTGFRMSLDDGDRIRVRRVVIATGLDSFAFIPEIFASLPTTMCSHTSSITNPGDYTGKRVVVVGGGQSALETAALIHEAGAQVEILTRAPQVRWLHRSMKLHQKEGLMRRLLYPPEDVGPPVLNQIVNRPHVWKKFPGSVGARIAYRSIRPAGAGWLIPRLENVPITVDIGVVAAETKGDSVALSLSDGTSRQVDAVVLGTGFKIHASRYSFLSRDILAKVRMTNGYPKLGAGFESSVPGVHFIGAVSALSFGPVMRFVSGTGFTARTASDFLQSSHA